MRHYVYAIIHRATCRVYVGKSSNPWKRLRAHAVAKGRSYIDHAIRCDGVAAFDLVILEGHESEEDAFAREIVWIARLESRDPRVGYNLTAGGEGVRGHRHSEQTRAQMRTSHMGLKHSDEHRARIRDGNTGKTWTAAQREKIRAAMRGRPMLDHVRAGLLAANLGRPLTEAHKAKLRGRPRRSLTEEQRATIVARHWSRSSMAAEVRGTLSRAASGRRPSVESRAKMRASQIGRRHSAETRAKMSESNPRRLPRAVDEQVAALWSAGHGSREIAAELRISKSSVERRVRALRGAS